MLSAEAIAQHIDYVIGMNAAIGDKAALEFAVGFYDALTAYDSQYDTYSRIEFGFNIACNAIQFAGVSGISMPIMKKKPHLGRVEEQVIVNAVNELPAGVNQNQMSEHIIAPLQNLRLADEGTAPIEAQIASHKEFVPFPDKMVVPPRIISSRKDLISTKQPNKYVAAPEISGSPIIKLPSPSSTSVPFLRYKKPIIGVGILTAVVLTFSFLGKPHNAPVTLQPNPAIADSTKSIQINPKNADDYYTRGISYHDQGKYELAIADFNKAIELKYDPLSTTYYKRGLSYNNLEDYNAAIEDYNKAIRLDPNYANAYYNRGNTHSKQGEKQLAIKDFKTNQEKKLLAIKDFKKAAEVYQKQGETKSYQKALDKIEQLQ